jgi:hypothetical protein
MSEEETLDYIPEDLSEENKQRLRELTVESEPEPASLEVNEYLIRHWCETLEDGNPLYMDADYAKSRGFRSVVAPPGSFMTAFAMPFRWPWPPGGREPAPHIHYDIKEALDLPVGIINKIDVEMGVPLQVGDRLSVSQRLVSVSPPKKTRLGEGHFWTMDRIYRNQHESWWPGRGWAPLATDARAELSRPRMPAEGDGAPPSKRCSRGRRPGINPRNSSNASGKRWKKARSFPSW